MAITLNIPETLNEVTLSQYQKWIKITDGKQLNTFYQQKMIEIFCKTNLRDVLQMKVSDINEITDHLQKLFEEKPIFTDKFKLNDLEFGFIPKLDEMTFGEYIDLDSYMSDWSTMHKAMSVLFRPIVYKRKEKYLIEDYETASKYNVGEMPLAVAMGSLVFFWNLSNELLTLIMNFLAEQQQIQLPQHLKDSLKNGGGINPFTDLQMVI